MLSVVIIEDNKLIADDIERILLEHFKELTVIAKLESVAQSLVWFEKTETQPNLLLMDISLTDGDSFSIIRECDITSPIIFLTGSENHLTEALRFQGIDYLLKPVNKERLLVAIEKYYKLKSHFTNLNPHLKNSITQMPPLDRIIVKLRNEYSYIKTVDVVCFFSEFKAVFAIDKQGRKFLCEMKNLYILEEKLDSHKFFRANRKTIVHIDFVKSYKIIKRSKIQLEMNVAFPEVIISQENANQFKEWMGAN